jgi:hypothetical protein
MATGYNTLNSPGSGYQSPYGSPPPSPKAVTYNGIGYNTLNGPVPGNPNPYTGLPTAAPSNTFASMPGRYGNGVQTVPASSSAAGQTGTMARLTSFNGNAYDLANPDQRQRYYNDVIGHVTGQTQNAYDTNLSNLVSSRGQQLGQMHQQESSLDAGKDNYFRDINNQGLDLNNQYGADNARRDQGAFSSNVFQSGVSAGQGYADNTHLRGLADLQAGGDQYQRQYDQQKGNLGLQGENFNRQYDQDTFNLGKQKSDSISNAKDQLAGNLGYYDERQNPGTSTQDFSGKYNLTPYTPPTAPGVNLGNVTPFTSSATLGGSPGAQQAGKSLASPTSNLTAQDQYYGYNPSSTDKNYVNNYFRTGNPNPQ